MTKQDPFDDRLVDLLVDYDEHPSSPTHAPNFDESTVAAELRPQFIQAKAALDLLRELRTSGDNGFADDEEFESLVCRDIPPVRRIGRFEIIAELGCGGFGIVYRAWDPRTSRDVALKIPRLQALASGDLRQRFEQEARAAARLDHPHIATVLDAGIEAGLPYMTSVYYPGVTLATWLRERTVDVDQAEAARLIQQLAEAMAHAHERGVLHRDIKPSNVLLVAQEKCCGEAIELHLTTPKLLDFGLAKLTAEAHDLTQTGMLLGTIRYLPPEQAAGRVREIGPAVDVYALGAILYELLTGQPPFAADSDLEVLRCIEQRDPSKIRELRRGASKDLETICHKCLEKDPSRRYPTAKTLAEDLGRYLQGAPILARPATSPERAWKWIKRNPARASLLALALASTTVLILGLAISNHRIRLERDRATASEAEATKQTLIARRYAYGTDFRLAQEAWDHSAPEEAIRIMDRYVPSAGETDLRGPEWHLLWNQIHRQNQILTQSDAIAWSLAASTDGKLFAIGDSAGKIQLRSVNPPRLLREISTGWTGNIDQVLFAPSGRELISGTEDGAIRIWSVSDGKLLDTLLEHKNWVGALAISPDGEILFSGDGDGRVLMWDLNQRKLLCQLMQQQGEVRCLAIDFVHPMIASFTEEGAAGVWDYRRRIPQDALPDGKLAVPSKRPIRAAAFSHNGHALYALQDKNILQWDANRQFQLTTLPEPASDRTLAISGDDKWLIVGGSNATPNVFLYRSSDFAQRMLRGHSRRIRCLAPIPQTDRFLSASDDGSVRLWKTSSTDGLKVGDIDIDLNADVKSLAFSADDRQLAIATDNGEVRVHSSHDGQLRASGEFTKPIRYVAFARNSQHVFVMDGSFELVSWDPVRGSKKTVLRLVDGSRFCLAGNDRLLCYEMGREYLAVRLDDGREVWRLAMADDVMDTDADGNRVFASCGDGRLYAFDANTGHKIAEAMHRGTVMALSIDRAGKRVVTASHDKTVRIFDRDTLRELARFSHETSADVAFLIGDGSRLMVHDGKRMNIIDPETAQVVLALADPVDNAMAVASSNGRLVAVQTEAGVSIIKFVP